MYFKDLLHICIFFKLIKFIKTQIKEVTKSTNDIKMCIADIEGEMAKSQGIIPFIDIFMHLYLMFNT